MVFSFLLVHHVLVFHCCIPFLSFPDCVAADCWGFLVRISLVSFGVCLSVLLSVLAGQSKAICPCFFALMAFSFLTLSSAVTKLGTRRAIGLMTRVDYSAPFAINLKRVGDRRLI